MNFLNSIAQFLKRPFPTFENVFDFLKLLIVMSLFIAFFLYVFQPFGMSNLESKKLLICLGFGSMTFIATILYELTIGSILRWTGVYDNWTFGKWMINNLGLLIYISVANFLFARLVLFGYIDWSLFPHMLYGTLMIGLLPLSVVGAFAMLFQEKKYQGLAEKVNLKSNRPFKIKEDRQSIFGINIKDIRYIESLQNYVKLVYIDDSGQLVKKTERATLKQILKDTKGSPITKSHRSILVNKKSILSVSGNAQGLLLSLKDCEKPIPVSRSFVPHFKEM